jgi:hypothetical protein
LPAAYNNSIYLMVGVPYTVLGIVGFMIYRGCKKNAAFLDSMGNADAASDAFRADSEPT